MLPRIRHLGNMTLSCANRRVLTKRENNSMEARMSIHLQKKFGDVHSKATTLVDLHSGNPTFQPSSNLSLQSIIQHTFGAKYLYTTRKWGFSNEPRWRMLQESGEGCLKPHTKRMQLLEALNKRAQTISPHINK